MRGCRLQVLLLAECSEVTAADVSQAAGLSPANASAVLSQLFNEGYLIRREVVVKRRGRPALAYRVKLSDASND
ncbi:helix-turn-helix domain-containing protein [Stenotrophomonas terrae]|uniref:helix-turn-helix domain-containing protein n=1 Tax=Stenotrophomonas terrae TaxID=405446 RepID=UPI003D360D8B